METVFVDDDNRSGIYDGTLDHPYRTIDDALKNAEESDVIFVFNGLYPERIKISTSIILIGENKKTTIVDGRGEGTVIDIYANNVEMSGFTIRNSGSGYSYEACGISVNADEVTISDMIISENYNGIHVDYSFQSTSVHHTQIYNNKKDGVIITYSNKFVISNNEIYENGRYGCIISNSIQGSITNNLLLDNNKSGITFWESSDNDLHHNLLEGNHEFGVLMNYSQNNDVYKNTIQDCSQGIYLYDSGTNEFYNNNFLKNTEGHAFFHTIIRRVSVDELQSSGRNVWSSNFWDTWDGNGAYVIQGTISIMSIDVTLKNVDRSPAQEPYDI